MKKARAGSIYTTPLVSRSDLIFRAPLALTQYKTKKATRLCHVQKYMYIFQDQRLKTNQRFLLEKFNKQKDRLLSAATHMYEPKNQQGIPDGEAF
jgi:hypothetical protein